jgi:hypothetical protein
MSTKQKALSGRPVKAYSITDTVKMVSCIEIQGVKVDMVEGVLSLICFKFSLISYFLSFYANSVLLIFLQVTHNEFQLDQAL